MAPPAAFAGSLRALRATRRARARQSLPALSPAEQEELLRAHHPDFAAGAKRPLARGPNAGEPAPVELAALLEAPSRIDPRGVALDAPDLDVDVLVIGAGGAGAAAAIAASQAGARVLLATKLRYGDSNTVMATGMACAVAKDDSPVLHFLDTLEGGGFTNVPELVAAMTHDGPEAVAWLKGLGANLRVPEWGRRWKHAARAGEKVVGHSVQRGVQAFGGITGMEITRALREEILQREIAVREFHPAVELLLDERGRCAGAVLENVDTRHLVVVRAGATILATGGMGRLHCGGFPTSNHYGATGDGLVIGYRAGARLRDQQSVQFHPTGIAWPEAAVGWLLTEGFRSGGGAQLVNAKGARFVNEVQKRDVVAAAIIRECARGLGVRTPSGRSGVWLDLPATERARAAADFTRRRLMKLGVDIAKEPILVHPTQHYQNGGILIDANGATSVECLYAAGEVSGGVHGTNRLGGNSMLDVFVFGRRAGAHAAARARRVKHAHLRLDHAVAGAAAVRSPLVYPDYPRRDPRHSQPRDREHGFE